MYIEKERYQKFFLNFSFFPFTLCFFLFSLFLSSFFFKILQNRHKLTFFFLQKICVIEIYFVPLQRELGTPIFEMYMKRLTNILFLAVVSLVAVAQSAAPGVFLMHPGTESASISTLVVNARTGDILDSYNPDLVLTPASCTKLLTTCTALELLGADFRFSTYLESPALVVNGVLEGDLFIRGTGDPTLGSRRVGDPLFLRRWVSALRRQGISRIAGRIVADLSFFDDDATNPDWQWEDMGNYYAPGISAIAYLDNTMVLNLRSGAIGQTVEVVSTNPVYPGLEFVNAVKAGPISYDDAYVRGVPFSNTRYLRGRVPANRETFGLKGDLPNPGWLLAMHLKSALADSGIVVDGEAAWTLDPDTLPHRVLYEYKSEPLSEIVKETNIESNNLYAEQVFRYLGSRVGTPATIEGSLGVERQCWTNRGVDLKTAIINDGCGLAYNNAVSARQYVSLLTYMRKKSKSWDAFYESLPISGETGTLKGLLRETPLHGRVHAKSGTIAHVKSYAGYIEAPDGETYTFAILVNHAACKSRVTTKLIGDYLLAVLEEN